jgi:hypothetical protein
MFKKPNLAKSSSGLLPLGYYIIEFILRKKTEKEKEKEKLPSSVT